MAANVGTIDRMMRVVFGLILFGVPFANFLTSDWIGQLMAGIAIIVGAVLIFSGILSRCLVYKVLGINTCNL